MPWEVIFSAAAVVASIIVTWLFKNKIDVKRFAEVFSAIDDVVEEGVDVKDAIFDALKPDADGSVTLTADEVNEIKVQIEEFIEAVQDLSLEDNE